MSARQRRSWLGLLLLVTLTAVQLTASRRRAVERPGPPTFNNEIVRILQSNCQTCHHADGIAPFPLMTWADAFPYAGSIKYMVENRLMPPWKASTECGELEGVRRLHDSEIQAITKWVEAGAPEGDPASLPEPLVFENDWTLGSPDLALFYPEPYTPPATDEMYRCFPMKTNLTTDTWVKSMDILPGDPGTVHHVIPYIDRTGLSELLDSATPEPGYECFGGPGFVTNEIVGGWSPGARPTSLPDGTAVLLPAGSRIVMQVHYSPHFEAPLPDQTQIGLYLAREEINKRLRYEFIVNDRFSIPPNDPDHVVVASDTLRGNEFIHLVSVYPHMHLLGQKISVDMEWVDGAKSCLIDIPDYDFEWQQNYVYTEPVPIQGGTRIDVTCHFDNSTGNPWNPNSPPKTVTWGERSTDEMCLALIGFTLDSENLAKSGH